MIKALFAVDQYGGMGYNGGLPWPHNRADMVNFQQLTNGHVVVMGRNTWDNSALRKPLLGRIVYVATHRPVTAGRISGNIAEEVLKIEKLHSGKTIWIVGGPDILNECRDLYDAIHLTHFKGSYKIDTKIDLKSFLSGFTIEAASVAEDIQSTFIRYAPIFKRTTGSPN